jgi:hypothetical protein
MNNRMESFYGRQSVDRADSISIESQLEFCQHELRGSNSRSTPTKDTAVKTPTDRIFNSLSVI